MPLYEYVCQLCGHKFDKLRSMREADSPIACQNCQSQSTRRVLSTCNCASEGKALAGASSGGCGGCGGGSCSNCRH